MAKKFDTYFTLLAFRPKLLYRKRDYYTNQVSLLINIAYLVTLLLAFIALIYQLYIRSIHSISSYYTPFIPANLTLTIEMKLMNTITNEPIENSESLISLTMTEVKVNSTELNLNKSQLKYPKKKPIAKSIETPLSYEARVSLYRNETFSNFIGIDIELCVNEIQCLSELEKADILSNSALSISFPSTYYNPIDQKHYNNTRTLSIALTQNHTENYLFSIEPQILFEESEFGFYYNRHRKQAIDNNYDFHSIERAKRGDNEKHHLLFKLAGFSNVIVISNAMFFSKIIPSIVAGFYLITGLFKMILKYTMGRIYHNDFEKFLIHKREVSQKGNQANFFKTFSLMCNTTHKAKFQTVKPLNKKVFNKVTTNDSIANLNINNENLSNSQSNIISNDDSANNFNAFNKNAIQKNPSNKQCENPPTVIRFTPNMPYTFQENLPIQNIEMENKLNNASNSLEEIINNNSLHQNPIEGPCLFQPISLNINFNNNHNSVNIPKESIKERTFLYKACCCYKVHIQLKDINLRLSIRNEIRKFASIDEVVSKLAMYDKLFPKMIEMIKVGKTNDALNDSNQNNVSSSEV